MMSYTIPQLTLLFFFYSFLGWCTEVAYAACMEGRFINRGFLNGPVCPIYGFGVILVLILLEPVGDDLPLLFLSSAAVTTAIELITGFLLEKLFHTRWWDYTGMPLNIGGYVCPLFSLLWGLACMIVVRFLNPPMAWLVQVMPDWLTGLLLSVLSALMAIDVVATVAAIRKLNDRLRRLSEMAAEIHALSDEIGLKISRHALNAKSRLETGEKRIIEERQRLDGLKARAGHRLDASRESARRRLSELCGRFEAALEERSFGQKRLLNAFPRMRSHRHQDALNALRKSYSRRKKK